MHTLHPDGMHSLKSGPNAGTSWGHTRQILEHTRPKTGTQYWFDGHLNPAEEENFMGGVLCCSTQDFVVWKNEGIVLHFANLSDPFGTTGDHLQAIAPKVVRNSLFNTFVMWMQVDWLGANSSEPLGLVGVAASLFPHGPFVMEHTLYPDAPLEAPGGLSINETHDLSVILRSDGNKNDGRERAFLVHTYFKTVNFWLPRAVMNPLWESVQTANGTTDFGLNYHRAFFHEDYDDPDDIYLQRWRMEDKPWSIQCCERANMTNCFVHSHRPGDILHVNDTANYQQFVPDDPYSEREHAEELKHADACPYGYKKKVLGQGVVPIHSRYKDPYSPHNLQWQPSSVPSHTTWGFQVYNTADWTTNYFHALSTNITSFVFHSFAGEPLRDEVEQGTLQHEYPNRFEKSWAIRYDVRSLLNASNEVLRRGVQVDHDIVNTLESDALQLLDPNGDFIISVAERTLFEARKGEKSLSLFYSNVDAQYQRLYYQNLAQFNDGSRPVADPLLTRRSSLFFCSDPLPTRC
jgi:hypothetical protein